MWRMLCGANTFDEPNTMMSANGAAMKLKLKPAGDTVKAGQDVKQDSARSMDVLTKALEKQLQVHVSAGSPAPPAAHGLSPKPPAATAPTKQVTRFIPCNFADFETGRVLGTGSFGRVFVAKHKPTGTVCAIKALSKAQMVKIKQVAHARTEKNILQLLDFPFVICMYGACQDDECVYFVLEYVCGGEFFTHLRSAGRFPEDVAKFYTAEVVLAFEYLHGMDTIYRDLKPENILLERDGHLKVTDFGFAKKIDTRTYTLCGTPDYLAPEIILNKGHGKAVDWWALGVLIYEMMAGYPPFYDDDPMATYKKILYTPVAFPPYFSKNARDLVKKLLQTDLTKRYGNLKGGANDIKSHPWFSEIDWDGMLAKKYPAPIKINVKGDDDTRCFEDFSHLGTMHHEFKLKPDEQAQFINF